MTISISIFFKSVDISTIDIDIANRAKCIPIPRAEISKWRSCLLPRMGLPTGVCINWFGKAASLCLRQSVPGHWFPARQTGTVNWAMESFKLSPCNINPVASPQLGITKEIMKDECSTVVLVNGRIGMD